MVGRAGGRSGGRTDGWAGGRADGRSAHLGSIQAHLGSPKSPQSLPKVSPKPPRLPQRPPEPNSSKNVKILIYSPTENWPKVIFEPDSIWFLDPPDALRVLSSIDLPLGRIARNVKIITFS